jgi:hypothetical protein
MNLSSTQIPQIVMLSLSLSLSLSSKRRAKAHLADKCHAQLKAERLPGTCPFFLPEKKLPLLAA